MDQFGKTLGEQMYEAALFRARVWFWIKTAGVVVAFAVALKYLAS